VITLPTTSVEHKPIAAAILLGDAKARQKLDKRLSIKYNRLKTQNHLLMHPLLEKLQVTKLSVGQGNMVTLALVRRGVGALVIKALVALSTIYT
jgi:hypothetical protein